MLEMCIRDRDEYGFDNLEEKSRLEQRAWEEYYASLEQNMEEENLLISEDVYKRQVSGLSGLPDDRIIICVVRLFKHK